MPPDTLEDVATVDQGPGNCRRKHDIEILLVEKAVELPRSGIAHRLDFLALGLVGLDMKADIGRGVQEGSETFDVGIAAIIERNVAVRGAAIIVGTVHFEQIPPLLCGIAAFADDVERPILDIALRQLK